MTGLVGGLGLGEIATSDALDVFRGARLGEQLARLTGVLLTCWHRGLLRGVWERAFDSNSRAGIDGEDIR